MTDAEDILGIQARKYLVFHLGDAAYGFGVLKVREIIDPPSLQRCDQAFENLAGLVTIRNKTIPVLDLRRRYGLPQPERKEGANRCVVVVQARMDDETKVQLGLLFDRPGGLAAVRGDDVTMQAAPLPGAPDDGVIGTARRPDGTALTLLNPDRLANDPAVAAMLGELT